MSEVVLEAREVCKRFPSPRGDIHVLEGVSLLVSAGESISIRGESGAGKTTLLTVLSGLESLDSGSIWWQGEAVENRSAAWQAKRRGAFIGFVFQAYYLVPELNALENVLLARRLVGKVRAADKHRAKTLLDRVGLGERLKHRSTHLSGGERQRVAIARALLNGPPLILADEPTGNLDETTGETVMETFLELCEEEKVALVLVTHNPDFAKRTQRRARLIHGKLEETRSSTS